MLARAHTFTIEGLQTRHVIVEVDIRPGLLIVLTGANRVPSEAVACPGRSDSSRDLRVGTDPRYASVVGGRETLQAPDRDRRAAQIAHVLARAVRDDELVTTDALRILRHELRRRNTNQALKIATRSTEAQRVIDEYGAANVPKNDSPDALHADHVYPLTEDALHLNDTLEMWINTMHRLRTVVCVTARENYRLETCERRGITGPRKYTEASVTFTTRELPWDKDK